MFKKLLLLALILSATLASQAQNIDAFKYQAVLRTGGTQVISNQNVALRFSIREGSPNGVEVYSEEHIVVTNAIGLVNLEIGNGQNVFGDMRVLDWGNTRYFVRTELDANGGNTFAFLGVSELLAVPYAFKAGDVVTKQDLEQQGDSIRATDNPNATWIDLSQLRDNTDDQSLRFQNGLLILTRELTEDTTDLNPFVQARLNQFGIDSVLSVNDQAAGLNIQNVGQLGIGTTAGYTLHVVDTVDQSSPNYEYSMFGQIAGGNLTNAARGGMYIEINGTDGENIAIDGTSLGSSAGINTGTGGYARGSSFINRGVQAFGDGGQRSFGLHGRAENGTVLNLGVLGEAAGSPTDQAGVRGFIDSAGTSATARNWGVNGFVLTESTNPNGNIGVEGAAEGSHAGTNTGVRGQAFNSGNNTGGSFIAGPSTLGGANFAIGARGTSSGAGTGINYGLYGEASNSTNTNRGVVGVLIGPTNRTGNLGVHLQDAAVYGLANGIGWNTAVLGRAIFANPSDTNVALLGNAANGLRNYALWTETGDAMFNDTAIFNYGTIQNGYVLTSDANGRATWQQITPEDSTNELISSLQLTPNDSLQIVEGGIVSRVDLSQFANDQDLIDSANAIRASIAALDLSLSNHILADVDIDSTNERISSMQIINDSLEINENGVLSYIDLGSFDNGWERIDNATDTVLYNQGYRVGVGTNTAANAPFQVETATEIEAGWMRNTTNTTGTTYAGTIWNQGAGSGDRYAGWFNTNGASTGNKYAGFFSSGNGTTNGNVNYGIYSSAFGADTNYAGYFASGNVYIEDTLIIPTGAQNGRVLTSDANGKASWQSSITDTLNTIRANDTNYVLVNNGNTEIQANGSTYTFREDYLELLQNSTADFRFVTNHNGRWDLLFGSVFSNALSGSATYTGGNNFLYGRDALRDITSGSFNIAFGSDALQELETGSGNLAFGNLALEQILTGNDNIAIGRNAGAQLNSNSSGNILIGNGAGGSVAGSMTGSIKIGSGAGQSDSTDNTLYIDPTGTTEPLIYGDFTGNELIVGGRLGINNLVGDTIFMPNADGTAGQVIETDGNGNLSFVTLAAGDTSNEKISGMSIVTDSLEIIESGDASYVDLGVFEESQALIDTANAIRTSIAAFSTAPQDLDSVLSQGSDANNDTIYNLRMLGLGTSAPTATIDIVDNLDNFNISIQNSKNTGTGEVKGVFSTVSGAGSADKFGLYGEAINGTGTNYGVFGEARRSGGVGTAYGIYGKASGGANNWAGYFENGNVLIENRLGIGIGGNPAQALDVAGTALIDKILTDSAEVDTLISNLAFLDSLRIGNAYSFPSVAGSNGEVLQINGSGDLDWAAVSGEDSTRLVDSDNDTRVTVENSADEDFIRFFVRGTEYLTMNNDGRMGINMVSPVARLCIYDTLASSGSNLIGTNTSVHSAGAGIGDTLIATRSYASGDAEIKYGVYSKATGGPTNFYYAVYGEANGGDRNYGLYSKSRSTNDNWGLFLDVDNGATGTGIEAIVKGNGGVGSISTGIDMKIDSAETVEGLYFEVDGIDLGTADLATGADFVVSNAFSTYGVNGSATGVNRVGSEAVGILGDAQGAESNFGAIFQAFAGNGSADTSIGIYASGAGSSVNYAGFFDGNVEISDTLIIPTGATNGFVLTSDANGKATWQAGAGASLWDSISTSLHYNGPKNVGIGTDSALAKLQVDSSWFIGSTSGSIGYIGSNTYFDGSNLRYSFDGAANAIITDFSDGDMILASYNSGTANNTLNGWETQLRITTDGVGINTDSPDYALDVNVNDSALIAIALNPSDTSTTALGLLDRFSGFVGVRAPDSIKTDYYLNLPDTAPSANQILIYDTAASGLIWATNSNTCPVGMVDINGRLCIDDAERTTDTWFVADSTCASLGFELADYGDWYAGTSNASLINETNNWEWVRNISQNKLMLVGNGGIQNRSFQDPSLTATYRCTYRRD